MPATLYSTPHRIDDETAISVATADPSLAVRLHDQMQGTNLQAGQARLWRAGKGCDITIQVPATPEDRAAAGGPRGRRLWPPVAMAGIVAHRNVLAAASAPLNQMIFGEMPSVDENNVLTLTTGIDLAALLIVVEYIYTGTLEFTQDTVWGVLEACKYLELDGATKLCTEFLCEQLTPANVLGVHEAAVTLHCAELEAKALTFAKANMAAVSEGAEWHKMELKEVGSLMCGTHQLCRGVPPEFEPGCPLSRAVPHWVVLKALGQWVEAPRRFEAQGVEYAPERRREAFVHCMAHASASTQCHLGICYTYGWGVAKDDNKSMKWFLDAAEQDDAEAQFNLGLCYFIVSPGCSSLQWKHLEKAMEWFTKAAEQGHARAQCNLGTCYMDAPEGVARDCDKAVEWFTKAAEQDDAQAMSNLGLCYQYGSGVAQDLGKAEEFFTKLAEQGHPGAIPGAVRKPVLFWDQRELKEPGWLQFSKHYF